MATLLLLALALPLLSGVLPVRAQDAMPVTLDEAHFGMAQVAALDPQAEANFTLALKAGDRVALDLQGENDSLQVTQFTAAYGSLELQTTAAAAYMAWAPEDGEYTITVKNTGDTAAGFTLRVVASPAPLPAKKIITADADGQTVPVTAGELFQVALDAAASEGYAWMLQPPDAVVLQQEGEPATVLLGTMPQAMSQQIFTFSGVAPGAATLAFDYAKEDGGAEKSFSVSIEVASAPTAEATPILPAPITLDQGDVLVIPLAGNPSTGYLWQIKPGVENILAPRGEADFTAPSDAPGAGGYEIFTFDAVAAGEVTLSFIYSQPWDEGTPPEQVIELPFVVAAPAAAAPAEPPAPPEPITIGADENGGAVDMQTGGMLFVELPGNPTTGYIWQITSKDDAFLQPVDYAFQPDSDATGAGGIERFEFAAVAAGEVVLEFAQSRPWETDAEPVATYAVTVTISEAPAN
jgi:inhibitor of cysteine peptidase